MDDGPDPINRLLDDMRREAPERGYLRRAGRLCTVSDIAALRDGLLGQLAQHGIGANTRVATLVSTTEHAIALIFALARSGASWIAPNSRLPAAALAPMLTRCAATELICTPDHLELAQALAKETGCRAYLLNGDRLEPVVTQPPGAGAGGESAGFALFFTSGTTGQAKAVQVSQKMLVFAARGALVVSGARPGDVLHCWEPLHHVGGAQLILMPLLLPIRLELFARFSASSFWSEVRSSGATHMHFLGGILDILLKAPASDADRDHGLRIAWGGGVRPESWRAFAERFGVQVRECYGMTECSSVATVNPVGPDRGIGWPLPWFDVSVRDPQTGAILPPGEVGEIVVTDRGPGALSAGYLGNPSATAASFREGDLRTSDLGSRDEQGAFHFHGRLGDRLRVRGENVSAWEIEHVIRAHPDVEEVAVIGVPAEIGEEDIKLFVQPAPGRRLDPEALTGWMSERLASFQLPRFIAEVRGFDRTPSQRIQKGRLPADTGDCWDRSAPRPVAGPDQQGDPRR